MCRHSVAPRAAAALLLLVAAGVACSDSSGPATEPGAVTVAVKVTDVGAPQYEATPEGISVLSCTVTLRASADGRGTATWRGATFRWYPGTDLTAPFDSATLSSGEVGQSWQDATIASGRPQVSGWIFSATVPFTLTAEYRYRAAGSSDESTELAQFTCQPPLPRNPGPPSITNLSLQPAAGAIEPGETLAVSFTSTAEAGLWQLAVQLSGACDTVQFLPGQLATSGANTVRIPISRSCRLGGGLGVTVYAQDAALAQTASGGASSLTVQDLTPPVLDVLFSNGERFLAGDTFDGDTLGFWPLLQENDSVRTVLWEVQPGGLIDSATPVPSGVGPLLVRVPITAAWVPGVQLTFTARDVAGNTSARVPFDVSNLRIYPRVTRPTSGQTVGGYPRDILPDPKRGVFYVLLDAERKLLTHSLFTAAPLSEVSLPAVVGFDLTPSGDSLVFLLSAPAAVGVLDLTMPAAPLKAIPLTLVDPAVFQSVRGIRATSNGKLFVSLLGWTRPGSTVLELDLGSGVETLRPDAGAGDTAAVMEASPGGDFLLVGDGATVMRRYVASTDQFEPAIAVSLPDGGSFSATSNGEIITFGLKILDRDLQMQRQAGGTLGYWFVPSFVTPDGAWLHFAYLRGLVRTRVSDGGIMEISPLPFHVDRIKVSSDGQWAVYQGSQQFPNGSVGVIDLR